MSVSTLPPPKDEEITPPPQNMDSLPELPPLCAPDILEAFALTPSSGDTSVDGVNMVPLDFDRFAFLGKAAIEFVVTAYLFNQERLLNDEAEAWRGLRNDDFNGARLFSAYVGGVYHQDGIQKTQTWIRGLIAHTAETTQHNSLTIAPEDQVAGTTQPSSVAGPSSSSGPEPSTLPHASTRYDTPTAPTQTPIQSRKRDREAPTSEEGRSSPSPKRPRVSSSSTDSVERHTISGSSSPIVHRTSTTPASGVVLGGITHVNFTSADVLAASSSRASTSSAAIQQDVKPNLGASSSSQPQKKWMSVLNEGCMVTKADREWKSESEGADHNKTWKATLTVPQLGVAATGEGKTKKLAQEEAARQVCERLNWTPDYKWS
ncbi:hypothetical protein FRC04_010911 [Tulasnella sp. 424]|nr:hypothetical protein FRC04_010911 [Tulasnella sp. 424]KAG8975728.1 hypothetical protein FRC05_005246 [Tulasnella sp. 425]